MDPKKSTLKSSVKGLLLDIFWVDCFLQHFLGLRSYAIKSCMFQVLNCYASLVYVAFARDIEKLRF